jgi:hypothetical protein
MKYIKSSRGYYYKEFSNGKRIRVSAEEYNTKKQKFKNEQEGGGPQYSAPPPQQTPPPSQQLLSPLQQGSQALAQEPLQQSPSITTQQSQNLLTNHQQDHIRGLANDDKEKKQIKKEAIEKKELEEKKRKKRLRFRQDIANELAQAIILMS